MIYSTLCSWRLRFTAKDLIDYGFPTEVIIVIIIPTESKNVPIFNSNIKCGIIYALLWTNLLIWRRKVKAKGTLILGVILFVFGLLTFFLLVPSVGPLRKLIENDNISLPIGISAFIICIIIGLILIAINENEEVNNYRKEKYKIKLYQEFIASIILGVFAIIGIVIGVFLDDFKILLISLAILIVSFGVFIYYQQKIKKLLLL